MSYIITVDSGCCESVDYIKSNDIRVISYSYSVDGNIYSDACAKRSEEIFSSLNRNEHCTAHAIEVSDYVDFWRRILSEGKPVVHISTGSGFDRSFSNALAAKDILLSQCSDSKLFLIDSGTLSCGCTMLLRSAVSLRAEGKNAEQCVAVLESEKHMTKGFLILDRVDSMYRANRLGRFSLLRTLLTGEKVVLSMNGQIMKNALIYTKKPIERLSTLISESSISTAQTLYICHSNAQHSAEVLARELCDEFGFKNAKICEMSTSQAAVAGNGALGVFFHSCTSEDSLPFSMHKLHSQKSAKPAYL